MLTWRFLVCLCVSGFWDKCNVVMETFFSECIWIYWNRIIKNNFPGGNAWDPFSHWFRYFFNYSSGIIWFLVNVYWHITWFLYCRYVSVSRFISTSKKLTILRMVCLVMFKPHFLNSLIMAILFFLISGPDKFVTFTNPSSLYKPTRYCLILREVI